MPPPRRDDVGAGGVLFRELKAQKGYLKPE
jgi:hypothetical protein